MSDAPGAKDESDARESAVTLGPERARLPRSVIALGWVSLLTDASSELIDPLLPLFLTGVLGAGAAALGWMEGLADALGSILKLLSGRWADRSGRCRPLVIAGYGISAVARPLVALATAPFHVGLVRVAARAGKGLRTSPRDALIAAATPESMRGAAYGFHRAMDHAGAVIGPLGALALLTFVTQDLRTIFWLAAIPGAMAVAVLVTGTREARPAVPRPVELPWRSSLPSGALLRLLVPLAVFTLGNASDLFLLLKLAGEGSGPIQLTLLWTGLHVVKSLSSLHAGRLVDRLGPARMIAAGWIVYALVYLGLALAESRAAIVALCLVYGTYHGLTEGAERALVSRLAPAASRGAAFGWYHLTVGLLALPASVVFGHVWDAWGSSAAFGMGAGLAALACLLLAVLRPSSAGP